MADMDEFSAELEIEKLIAGKKKEDMSLVSEDNDEHNGEGPSPLNLPENDASCLSASPPAKTSKSKDPRKGPLKMILKMRHHPYLPLSCCCLRQRYFFLIVFSARDTLLVYR